MLKKFSTPQGLAVMNQTTRWLSLIAGSFLFLYGLWKLYEVSDWVPAILGACIVGFSAFGILKHRQKQP